MILVVDDIEIMRMTVRLIVERSTDDEIEALMAGSGQEAVKIVSERDDIDLILLDYQMPFQNGIQTTRKIVEIRPDIKIVFISAYDMDFMSEARDAGATACVTKDKLTRVLPAILSNDFDAIRRVNGVWVF